MDKKSLGIIVEEFFDTGKWVLIEDIEIVDPFIFKGIEKIDKIRNEYPNYQWVNHVKNTQKNGGHFTSNTWNNKENYDKILEYLYEKRDKHLILYIETLKSGKWNDILRYSNHYKNILKGEKLTVHILTNVRNRILSGNEYSKTYLFNDNLTLTDGEIKEILNRTPKVVPYDSLKTIENEDLISEIIKKAINYLNDADLEKLPNKIVTLFSDVNKKYPFGYPKIEQSQYKYIDNNIYIYKEIRNIFKDNIVINFYFEILDGYFKHQRTPNETPNKITWSRMVDIQKIIQRMILGDGKKIKKYDNKRLFNLILDKIIKNEIPYIFNRESGIISDGDLLKIEEVLEKSYEESFTELSFSKRDSSEIESRIHTLPTIKYNLTTEIISDKKDSVIAKELIKNIKSTLKENPNIIKYDLVADKNFYDKSGEVIIYEGSKIEVKDIKYSDSYFAEMLASPVKQTDSTIRENEKYLEKYNNIITEVFKFLQKYKVNLPTQFKNQLSGMILSNNVYVPNTHDNIELYLSPQGRNNIKKEIRIAIRYRINMNNIDNFYRIGDGIWEISDKIKSKPEVMYSLTDNTLLSGVEKDKVEYIPNSIEESITNFLDTGNFEF